jgi:hypothetical protein
VEEVTITPEEEAIGFEIIKCNKGHNHKVQHIAPWTEYVKNYGYPCTTQDSLVLQSVPTSVPVQEAKVEVPIAITGFDALNQKGENNG